MPENIQMIGVATLLSGLQGVLFRSYPDSLLPRITNTDIDTILWCVIPKIATRYADRYLGSALGRAALGFHVGVI